jgi:hypothetical protein
VRTNEERRPSAERAKWAAIGAAIAVSLGAGGFGVARATVSSGERAAFVPTGPCRAMDTRVAPDNVGPRITPIGPDETYSIPVVGVSGFCVLPTDTTGVVMNVTAVGPTANSFLTVFPQGGARPLSSNLNFVAGQAPIPNAVTVDVGASGQVSFYNHAGSVNVVADIVGYYVDHNHDDRYYTKLQIDRKTMFAVVNSNGTLRRGSDGVESALVPAGVDGDYSVTFPRAVAACGWVASPVGATDTMNPLDGQIGVSLLAGNANGLYVQANKSDGTDFETPFSVIVNCP